MKFMKWWVSVFILAAIFLSGRAFAAAGPQVTNRDGRISISANHVTLGLLVHLWDKATGMESKVAPELAGRTLSVHFTGLNENDAVRAIFLGQPFGYAFVPGEGIVVTSQVPASTVAQGPSQSPPAAASTNMGPIPAVPQNPNNQRMKPQPVPEQPVTITPSPFGAIVTPAGTEPPVVQLPPIPGAPLPPPFFRQELPGSPSGTPYSPGHNMLYAPLSVQP